MTGNTGPLGQFSTKYPNVYSFLKDVAFSLAIVAMIASTLYMYAGGWPAIVSVQGISMYPHMHDGDLVLLQTLNRVDVQTYDASISTGYKMYSDYGDVIVYWPYGDRSRHPVIHRAMYWVEKGELMWPGGPVAPASGFITKGDHNAYIDQEIGICQNEPVRPEWIVGVSKLNVPYVGYIRSLLP